MKLIKVRFASSGYDPRMDSEMLNAAKAEFSADDGYDIEVREGLVFVRHSGRTAVYGLSSLRHGLLAIEDAAGAEVLHSAERLHSSTKHYGKRGKQ